MGQILLPKQSGAAFRNPHVAPPENLVEIDWRHPMAEGLLFYSIGFRDMVSGNIGQPIVQWGNVNSGRNHGPHGFGLESHSILNGGFIWENCVEFRRVHGTRMLTLMVSIAIDGVVANARFTGVPIEAGSWPTNHTNCSLGRATDSAGLFYFQEPSIPSMAGIFTNTGYVDVDGKYNMYGVTKNDTSTINFYKNGSLFQAVINSDGSATFDWPSQFNVYSFSRNTTADGWGCNGRLQVQAWWMRELLAGEHQQFYSNPYALLKPRTPVLYHFQSVAPGPLDNDLTSAMHFQRHYEPIPAPAA